MKKVFSIVAFTCIAVLLSGSMNAQGKYGKIGKMFSKTEANTLFGKVTGSVKISIEDLREAVANAGDYVYITIKHSTPIFTNEKRESLIKKYYMPSLTPDEKMIVFSKSAVEDFLKLVSSAPSPDIKKATVSSSKGIDVSVERRAEVTTLSANGFTLEMALLCPPNCPY